MRESDGAVDVHAVAVSDAPHGAGKIAEAVGGEQSGAFEWGNKKTAGEMSLMMFDAMKFSFYFFLLGIAGCGEGVGNTGKGGENLGALTGEGRHAQGIN